MSMRVGGHAPVVVGGPVRRSAAPYVQRVAAPLERVTCTIGGCGIVVVPRVVADVAGDPRLREAVELERETMQLLGDTAEGIERDLTETLALSSFALAYAPSGRLVGAVRFMLGSAAGVKTLWDVDRRA